MTFGLASAAARHSTDVSSGYHQPPASDKSSNLVAYPKIEFYSPMIGLVNSASLSALRYIESCLGSYHDTALASRFVNIPRSNLEVTVFETEMNNLRVKHQLDEKFLGLNPVDQTSLTALFARMESGIHIPRSETGKTLRIGNCGFDTCTSPDVNATHKSNQFISQLLELVQSLPKGANILEIGGGYGGLLRAILDLRPDLKITSISADPNPIYRGIARLSESQRDNVQIITGTVPKYDIPTLDKKFDLVIQNRFTHFLNSSDLDQLTYQVASSLKDDGKLAIAQLASTNGSYRNLLGDRESIPASEALPKQSYALKGDLYPRSQDQLSDVVRSNGLTIDVSSGYGAKQFDATKRDDNQFDNIFVLASK